MEWRRWAFRLLWVGLGAVTIAGFFVMAYFHALSPVQIGDPGLVLLPVPLLIGFILGVLLTDEEIVLAAGAGVLTAVLALALITLFLFSPVLAGVVAGDRAFAAFSLPQVMLATILLFPLVVVGSAIGRGFGDLFLPSPRVQQQLAELREETRRWHEALERLERRAEVRPPPESPEEKKD